MHKLLILRVKLYGNIVIRKKSKDKAKSLKLCSTAILILLITTGTPAFTTAVVTLAKGAARSSSEEGHSTGVGHRKLSVIKVNILKSKKIDAKLSWHLSILMLNHKFL